MRPVSMCVPSWNEAPALTRLLTSSLPASDLIHEWVVVDHRSTDGTLAALNTLRPTLTKHGVRLRIIRESRDFSASFTMADLRNIAVRACQAHLVAMMDADFILGSDWEGTLKTAVHEFARHRKLAAIRFRIPVIWDRLRTDASGRISDHGRVWVHPTSSRIVRRHNTKYKQDSGNGRWERMVFPKHCKETLPVENDGGVLVSVNVKPADRIALRDTMTFFLEDALAGRTKGTWLREYARGKLRNGLRYEYDAAINLRGARLNAPNLTLGAAP